MTTIVYQVYETQVDYDDYPVGNETTVGTYFEQEAAKNMASNQRVYNHIKFPNRRITVNIRELEVM